jgi:cyclin-dependent kinase 8/11
VSLPLCLDEAIIKHNPNFSASNQFTMHEEWSHTLLQSDPMRFYRAKRDRLHQAVTSKYTILGFISSGTYGRVYKAQSLEPDGQIHAIKKFKPDKEGDVVTYTGISQSAIREIAVSLFILFCIRRLQRPLTSS